MGIGVFGCIKILYCLFVLVSSLDCVQTRNEEIAGMKLLSFVVAFSCVAFVYTFDETTSFDTTTPVAPTTTASAATTQAPAVKVPINSYNFSKNGVVCLKATFAAHFIHEETTWPVGGDAHVDDANSECNRLTVNFGSGNFTIQFNMTDKKSYYIYGADAYLTSPSMEGDVKGLKEAKATNGSSYLCKHGLDIALSNNITFRMTDMQLQPYYVQKDGAFSPAENCESDLLSKHFGTAPVDNDTRHLDDLLLSQKNAGNRTLSQMLETGKPTSSLENGFEHSRPDGSNQRNSLEPRPDKDDIEGRNIWLITTVQRLCGDEENFSEFKSSSGQFRQGRLSATRYYQKCRVLLGKEHFKTVFMELVDLLPDADKQEELMRAHNDS